MSNRVDANVMKDLKKFGIGDWNECYHCGNCTAVCPLTEQGNLFPRKGIRQMQMGLKDKISGYVEPWLCYYCGDCSDTCPRGANPGELMMTLRRYLTSLYDWTGLSRKFYTSKVWEVGFIAFFAILVVVLFSVFLPPTGIGTDLSQNLTADGGVKINSLVNGISDKQFVKIIEFGDWTMAVIVSFFLLSNIFNMYRKVILADKTVRVPFFAYIKEFWRLVWNFLTQARFNKCSGKSYWIGHLLLMTGYTLMFTLIVVFLKWFQTEEVYAWYHPQRLLGYYATFGILFFLIYAFIGRLKKKDTKMQFSHVSDWLFVVMLFLTAVTGILVHFFRIGGMVHATYYMYVIHLAVLVPMVLIEVPFSKWSHLAYRPIAIYFANLKKSARAAQGK